MQWLFVKCQKPSKLAKAAVMFIEQSVFTSVQFDIHFSSAVQQKCPHTHSSVSYIFHTEAGNVNRGIHLEFDTHALTHSHTHTHAHMHSDRGIGFSENDLVGVF